MAFTQSQVRAINLLWVTVSELTETNEQLKDQIGNYKEALENSHKAEGQAYKMIDLYEVRIKNHSNIIKDLEGGMKDRDRKIKRMKWQRGILGVVSVGLAAVIVVNSIGNE